YRLAGEKAPALPEGERGGVSPPVRRKQRRAWAAWWKEHGAALEKGRVGEVASTLGFTTVVLLDAGAVLDLDGSNRVRWQIDGLQMPLDVQRLPGDRVLLAEHKANKVTERDRTGKVVWEVEVDGPLMAQRLPGGNTFIATREGLVEVDRGGKKVFRYRRPTG